MKSFKSFLFLLNFTLLLFLSGCNSTESTALKTTQETLKICPQCHMEISKSYLHSSILTKDNKNYYFDDIGCMILWSSKNHIDLREVETMVFSNDSKKYIDAYTAYYKVNEKTPMKYGFSSYEMNQENSICFNKVIIKMLRGEHMANPKIRKQILGY